MDRFADFLLVFSDHIAGDGWIFSHKNPIGNTSTNQSGAPEKNSLKKCLKRLHSLKLTAKAPENGWLEYDPFLLGFGLFSGALAVSFREGSFRECK